MRLVALVSARLQRPDLGQAAALLFAALVVTLSVNWPDGGARVNASWPAVAGLRNAALGLLGLALGAQLGAWQAGRAQPGPGVGPTAPTQAAADLDALPLPLRARVAWLALLVLVVLTLPFELVARAGSYPATPGYWPALAAVLTVSGCFGLGLLLGRLVRGPYAGALLLVLAPAAFALLIWADFALGVAVSSPWAAPLVPAPLYAGFMLILSLPAVLTMLPPRGRAGA